MCMELIVFCVFVSLNNEPARKGPIYLFLRTGMYPPRSEIGSPRASSPPEVAHERMSRGGVPGPGFPSNCKLPL